MIQDTQKTVTANSRTANMLSASRRGVAEYYNALLRNLRLHSEEGGGGPQAIGVASLPGGHRASVVATNLAICIANADNRSVILVNSDPRNQVSESTFKLDSTHGIYDLLSGDCSLEQAIQPTDVANLSAISCGEFERGLQPISCIVRFGDVLAELRHTYAIVIVDLPAANELTPCYDMASRLDGVVLEIDSGNVSRQAATQSIQQLRFAETLVLGCVFNHS